MVTTTNEEDQMGVHVHHNSPPPEGLDETGRRTSHALTEARTVYKRAATALATLRRKGMPYQEHAQPGDTEWVTKHVYDSAGKHIGSDHYTWRDPDADAIEAALEQVVALLAPFERTGRPTK